MTTPEIVTGSQAASEPQGRSSAWFSRIRRYYVRRHIAKAIARIHDAMTGLKSEDERAYRWMHEAETYLRAARSEMRENTDSSDPRR